MLAARAHDVNHLGALIEGFCGTVPADKGFIDQYQTGMWLEKQQTQVVTPVRWENGKFARTSKIGQENKVLA